VRYCGGQARDSIGGAGHDDPQGAIAVALLAALATIKFFA